MMRRYNPFLSKYFLWIIGLGMGVMMYACHSSQPKKRPVDYNSVEKSLEDINRHWVKTDNDAIKSYVKRHQWHMQQTGTGLWYEIYEHGTNDSVKNHSVITVNYKVYLMDGTLCYSSDSTGSKTFRIGHGGVESGLEQGILLLCKHDKARFIMQPYMAHGLLGDLKKIPPRSTIIYYVDVLDVR